TPSGGSYYTFVLANGEEISFRVIALNDTSQEEIDTIGAKLNGKPAGTQITITTLVANSSTPYFLLFNGSQITVGDKATDQVLGDLAVDALELPAANAEVTSNLTLPTTGLFGLQ